MPVAHSPCCGSFSQSNQCIIILTNSFACNLQLYTFLIIGVFCSRYFNMLSKFCSFKHTHIYKYINISFKKIFFFYRFQHKSVIRSKLFTINCTFKRTIRISRILIFDFRLKITKENIVLIRSQVIGF